jgi:hypothetical protein
MEGIVWHRRTEQAVNELRYHVRYVLVLLDAPPALFRGDYMTADEVCRQPPISAPDFRVRDYWACPRVHPYWSNNS